jgi:two-component system, cell cycle sensor histidine kinase PleC
MRRPWNENPEYKAGRVLKRQIAAFCAAIIAASASLLAWEVIKERKAALDRARGETANLAAGFEEGIHAILNGVAEASQFLKDDVEQKEAKHEALDLNSWKNTVQKAVTPIIDIFIVDADGKLKAATIEQSARPVDYFDREYFLAHRDNPGLGLLVGHPIYGKLEKRMIVPVSRRLNTPDGQFAGVLIFTIDPGLMTALHSKIDLGSTGGMSLLFDDGILFARYTSQQGFNAALVGRKVDGIPALRDARSGTSGAYVYNSSVDGTRRIYSWRKVAGYPLIDLVGFGEAETLAPVNHQAAIMIGIGLAAPCLALIMMLMLNREISRRVHNAIARDEEAKKAQQANRVKSVFLANMSHELRTPLNAILGFAEIIRDKAFGSDEKRYREYAGDIHRSGAHLLNIVNDLLEVGKIEAGKLDLREEEVRIGPIVQDCLTAIARVAAERGVTVVNATADANAVIVADGTKLKQIIINLLSNAVKFTPPGGSASIAVIAEKSGGLSLKIRDTGIGMSDEEIKDALELFGQVDNGYARRFEGTGLGLPLAVQYTELHGGTLTIESKPGVGTEVRVSLPPSRITWD